MGSSGSKPFNWAIPGLPSTFSTSFLNLPFESEHSPPCLAFSMSPVSILRHALATWHMNSKGEHQAAVSPRPSTSPQLTSLSFAGTGASFAVMSRRLEAALVAPRKSKLQMIPSLYPCYHSCHALPRLPPPRTNTNTSDVDSMMTTDTR